MASLQSADREVGTGYPGKYGNEVLYRMCREKPGHDDLDVVYSKLWLIGRSYAAQLERKAGGGEKVLERAAQTLISEGLDQIIHEVRDMRVIDRTVLSTILRVHDRLARMLSVEAKLKRPSLASKYLHFHVPDAFFIYDSRAWTNVSARLKQLGVPIAELRVPADCKYESNPYPAFSIRAVTYRDRAMNDGDDRSPRGVDRKLYGY